MSSGIHFFVAINVLVHRNANADEFLTLQTKPSQANATLESSSSSSTAGNTNKSKLTMQSEIEAMPGKPQVKLITTNKRQHEIISFPNAQLLLQTLKASGDFVHIMTTWGVEETIAIVKAFGWANFIVDVRTLSKLSRSSSEYYTLESVKCDLQWLTNAMFIVRNKKEWHERLHEWIIEINHSVARWKYAPNVPYYKQNTHRHSHEYRTFEDEGRLHVNGINNDSSSNRAKTKTPLQLEKHNNYRNDNKKFTSNRNADRNSAERKHKKHYVFSNEKPLSVMSTVTNDDNHTNQRIRNKQYEYKNNCSDDYHSAYRELRALLSSMELLYGLCRCLTLAEWRVRFPGTPIVSCIALSKCTLFNFCRFYLLLQQEEEEEVENMSLLLLQINKYGGIVVQDEMQATHVICSQASCDNSVESKCAVKTNRETKLNNYEYYQQQQQQEINAKELELVSSQSSSSWSSSSSSSSSSFESLSSSSSELLSSEEETTSSEEEEEEEYLRSSELTSQRSNRNNKTRQTEETKRRNTKNNSKTNKKWKRQEKMSEENTISDTDSISSVPSSSSSASFEEMMRNDGLMSSRNVDETVLRERQERRSIALRRSEVAQKDQKNSDASENVNTPSARAPFTPRGQLHNNAISKAQIASNNIVKNSKKRVAGTKETIKSNKSKINDNKNTNNKNSKVTNDSKSFKETNKPITLLRNTQAVVITPEWIANCCRAWRILPVNKSWSTNFTEKLYTSSHSSSTLPSSSLELSEPTQSKTRVDSQQEQLQHGEMHNLDELLRTCGVLLCAMLPPEDARPLPFVHFLYIAQLYLYNYTFLLADTFTGTVNKVQMYFGDVVKLRQSKTSQARLPNLTNVSGKSNFTISPENKSVGKHNANDKTSVYAEGAETLMLFRNERKRDHTAVASHLQLLSAQFEYSLDHVRREWRLRNSAATGTQTSAPRFASMAVNTEPTLHYTKSDGFQSSQDDEHSDNAVVVVKLENEHQSQEMYDNNPYGIGQDTKGVFDFIRNAHALPLHSNSADDFNAIEHKRTYTKQATIKLEEELEEEWNKEKEEVYNEKQLAHNERWLTLSTDTNTIKYKQEETKSQPDHIVKHSAQTIIQSDMNTSNAEIKMEPEEEELTLKTQEEEVEASNMEAEEKINENDSDVKEWRLHLKNVEGKLLKSKHLTQETTQNIETDEHTSDYRQKKETAQGEEICTSEHTENSDNENSQYNTLHSTCAQREELTFQKDVAHENIVDNSKSRVANIQQLVKESTHNESSLATSTSDEIHESVLDIDDQTRVLSNITTTIQEKEQSEQTAKDSATIVELADSIFPLPPLPISFNSSLPLHAANRLEEINSYYHQPEMRLHNEQTNINPKYQLDSTKYRSHMTSLTSSTSEFSILPLPEHGTSSILPLAPTTASLFPLPPTIMTTLDELHALQKKQQQQEENKLQKDDNEEESEEEQHLLQSHVETEDIIHEKTKMQTTQLSSLSSEVSSSMQLPENASENSENSETNSFTKCFIPTYKLSVEQQLAFANYLRQLPLFANDDNASVEMEAMGVQCCFATHRDASDFLRVRYLEHDNVHLDIFPLHETLPTASRELQFNPITVQTVDPAHLYPIDSLIIQQQQQQQQQQESMLQHELPSESTFTNYVFDGVHTTPFETFATHDYDTGVFSSTDSNLQTFSGQQTIENNNSSANKSNDDKETTSVTDSTRKEAELPLLRVYKSVNWPREEEKEDELLMQEKHTLELNKSREIEKSNELDNRKRNNEDNSYSKNVIDAPEQLNYEKHRHERHHHRSRRSNNDNNHHRHHRVSDNSGNSNSDNLTSEEHQRHQFSNLWSEQRNKDKPAERTRYHHYPQHHHREHKRYRNESADSKESASTSTRYKSDRVQRTDLEKDKETLEKHNLNSTRNDNITEIIDTRGSGRSTSKGHRREKTQEEESHQQQTFKQTRNNAIHE